MKTELVLFGKHIDMTSRVRRRSLVALLYLGFAGYLAISWFANQWDFSSSILLCVPLAASTWILSRLTGHFQGDNTLWRYKEPPRSRIGRFILPKEPTASDQLDERELRWRDRAHFCAYRVLAFSVMILWVLIFAQRDNQLQERAWPLLVARHPWRSDNLLYAVAISVFFASATLPQSLLLWFAPDMEIPESTDPAAPPK